MTLSKEMDDFFVCNASIFSSLLSLLNTSSRICHIRNIIQFYPTIHLQLCSYKYNKISSLFYSQSLGTPSELGVKDFQETKHSRRSNLNPRSVQNISENPIYVFGCLSNAHSLSQDTLKIDFLDCASNKDDTIPFQDWLDLESL